MPDETKGTPRTNPKGTPPDETEGTPKDKGKPYTVAQIDKIKSDAAAMGQGRAEKVAAQEKTSLTKELQSTKGRLDALESEVSATRLAEARGDPDAMKIYQREEAVTKREKAIDNSDRDIASREEALKTDRAEVDKDKGVVSLAYVAAKHGLQTEELESLGISDPEALERVAEKLATKSKGEGDGTKETEETTEELEPDPGTTTGSGKPTQEQLEKMPMKDYAAHVEKRDEKK